MNNTQIHGRLTKDPELSEYTTAKGDKGSRCRFTVAVDRRFGEGADFFNCVIFGRRAEVIDKFFTKGSEIVVCGEMQCNPYDAKDGTKRYPWTLVVQDFDFCGGRKDGERQASGGDIPDNIPEGFEKLEDEDIPF